jgi:hypothetical protein
VCGGGCISPQATTTHHWNRIHKETMSTKNNNNNLEGEGGFFLKKREIEPIQGQVQ